MISQWSRGIEGTPISNDYFGFRPVVIVYGFSTLQHVMLRQMAVCGQKLPIVLRLRPSAQD